jgi:hypothetical protein
MVNRKLNGPIVLLDLDNCVSDDGWRIPMIDWQQRGDARYHRYHSLSAWDKPGNWYLTDMTRYPTGSRLVIVTARPNIYRHTTEHWLISHHCAADRLIMRPDGNHKPSVDVKRAQVQSLLFEEGLSVEEIWAAYDDHSEIIDMYRDIGIRHATQCKIHDVDVYKQAAKLSTAKELQP